MGQASTFGGVRASARGCAQPATVEKLSLCHWGSFTATIEAGRLAAARPWRDSGANAEMIGAWPKLVYSERRIDRPHVRAGFLKHRERSDGGGRGHEEMVPVGWDEVLSLVCDELQRVHAAYGPTAVFGGSYGWSSAGRFHHARSQVRRFLAAAGGFTDQTGNYSWGAAQAILPHVLGDHAAVSAAATAWQTIVEHSDSVVAFGGLNPKNWRVTSGGAGQHAMSRFLAGAVARGVKVAVVSPFAGDLPEGLAAQWIAPRPNSDTAIMLALAWMAVECGRADRNFLQRYTQGHEAFIAYLKGVSDGQPKTLEWAAAIADVPVAELEALWETVCRGRVMLTASWSLQRADHGEQPFWALIALAAVLGQIGLPGGGFTFGYGSMNAVGAGARRGLVPSLPGLPNPANVSIPVARFVDMLLNPGREIAFNGTTVTYPDVKLVYWAGGNPFHHGQDLFRQEVAWRRPETIIVHEPWWTPTARRADIVLPVTTTAERNDVGGSSRDPYVFAMPRLISPVGQARDDFAIFRELAEQLGKAQRFDEGLDEAAWLRRLWDGSRAEGQRQGLAVPDFETFWDAGYWQVPPPEEPEVLLQDFSANPQGHPLKTPSGKIELFSTVIAGFGYAHCPPHPSWLAPGEWLGSAAPGELHLLTNQPARRLHSQLYQTQDEGLEPVLIHPDDADARAIEDGATVRLWNRRGACLARATLSSKLRRGVLLMATGAWFSPQGREGERLEVNGNPNVLTDDHGTSQLGQACAALSALVRIEPYRKD